MLQSRETTPEAVEMPRSGAAREGGSVASGEPYVSLRKDELVNLLVSQARLDDTDAHRFRRLCELIEAVLHQDYHQRQEHLKRLYAPFDPDSDTRPFHEHGRRPRDEMIAEFLNNLSDVLGSAHYRPLAPKDLDYALSGTTYWGLDLQIDRGIFDRLMIFVRGDASRTRVHRDISTWFRRRAIDLDVYQRVVLVVKLRDNAPAGEGIDTHSVYLKLFREIPRLDLEMLLPGTCPRIRWLDAGKIGGSSVTGIFSLTKVVVESVLLGKLKWLMVAIGTFAYALQSFLGYQRTKAAYLYTMTQQLYYQNLDNNAGVFCRVIDEAEDEETKEAILAYFFLWHRASNDWSPQRLADEISVFLRQRTGEPCQFQAREAIAKLERLGLLTDQHNHLEVVEPNEALGQLSRRWGEYIVGRFEA